MRTTSTTLRLAAVLAVGALAASLALAGCGASEGADDGGNDASQAASTAEAAQTVTVQGSDTMVNMSQAWAEAFQAANENITVSVTGGGSGTGFSALISGSADFANASREIKDEEAAELPDAVETTVAYDGISIIVNEANGIDNISSEDLGRIYRGEVTNWSELGGVDSTITVCSRDTASGTYEFFKETIVDGEDEQEITADALYLTSNKTILDEVAQNEGAIGYIGLGYVDDTVKTLTLDGVASSVETVKDASYPLARALYMYSNGTLSEAMQSFLDFVLGSEGQAIVEEQGFVSL